MIERFLAAVSTTLPLLAIVLTISLPTLPARAQATWSDAFSSAVIDGIDVPPPSSIYAPGNSYASRYAASPGTEMTDYEPGIHDIFNKIMPTPVADWWQCEKSAEDSSFDPFCRAKPVDQYKAQSGITLWREEQMPLRVYISLRVTRARDGRAKALIHECLDQWVRASDHIFTYELTEDYRNAELYFCQHDSFNNYWGETLHDFDKGRVEAAKIQLQEQTLLYLPERRFKAVCLHQIGHALGLSDVQSRSSVMSQYCCESNCPIVQVSDLDKRYILDLYACRFDRLPAILPPLASEMPKDN